MSNYIDFQLSIYGRQDNVNHCIEICTNKDNVRLPDVRGATLKELKTYPNDYSKAIIIGECNWSINLSMMPGEMTTYDNWVKSRSPFHEYMSVVYGILTYTNLCALSKQFSVDIEAFGRSDKTQFSEHYKISKGECILSSTVSDREYYIEPYDTYDKYIAYWKSKMVDVVVTKEEFDKAKSEGLTMIPLPNREWKDSLPFSE